MSKKNKEGKKMAAITPLRQPEINFKNEKQVEKFANIINHKNPAAEKIQRLLKDVPRTPKR
jgi:hypothetical protein